MSYADRFERVYEEPTVGTYQGWVEVDADSCEPHRLFCMATEEDFHGPPIAKEPGTLLADVEVSHDPSTNTTTTRVLAWFWQRDGEQRTHEITEPRDIDKLESHYGEWVKEQAQDTAADPHL